MSEGIRIPYEKPRILGEHVCVIDESMRAITVKGPIVRCRDCKHSLLHGKECRHFSAYEPIAGGDEYEEMTFGVEPDGFCAWGVRRAE